MRLFTAISIPEVVKDRLLEILYPIDGLKWQDKSQMHLTLRFIGEVDGETARRVVNKLEHVTATPFSITLAGLGSFPEPENGTPKVIWVGIQENNALAKLQARIEQACCDAGLEPDERTFKPHVTLGRNKGADAEELISFMQKTDVPEFKPIQIETFYLFRSELTSQGAIHHVEKKFPLD